MFLNYVKIDYVYIFQCYFVVRVVIQNKVSGVGILFRQRVVLILGSKYKFEFGKNGKEY